MRIAIFIVNHNGLSALDNVFFECLDSFVDMVREYENIDLWFVDSRSSDSSVEEVKKRYGNMLNYITLSYNLGYSGACDIAYIYTKKIGLDYEYYICSNNDIQIFKTKIDKVFYWLKVLEKKYPKGFIAAPLLLNAYDGYIDFGGYFVDETGGTWSLRLVLYNADKVEKVLSKPIQVNYCDGAFLIVHRNVIKNIDLFDPRFFLYYEDVELSLRAWSHGYPSVLVPVILGRHYRSIITRKINLLSSYLNLRNRVYSIISYMNSISLLKFILWYLLYPLRVYETRNNRYLRKIAQLVIPGTMLHSSNGLTLSFFKYMTRAFLEGVTMALRNRKNYQKIVRRNILACIDFTDIFSFKKIILKLQKSVKQYLLNNIVI